LLSSTLAAVIIIIIVIFIALVWHKTNICVPRSSTCCLCRWFVYVCGVFT